MGTRPYIGIIRRNCVHWLEFDHRWLQRNNNDKKIWSYGQQMRTKTRRSSNWHDYTNHRVFDEEKFSEQHGENNTRRIFRWPHRTEKMQQLADENNIDDKEKLHEWMLFSEWELSPNNLYTTRRMTDRVKERVHENMSECITTYEKCTKFSTRPYT